MSELLDTWSGSRAERLEPSTSRPHEEVSEVEGEREEPEEEAETKSGELVEVQRAVPAKSEAKEPTERTDDPVRMYLREMGSVELLSREPTALRRWTCSWFQPFRSNCSMDC